jgi:hypothetical protein
MKNRLNPVIYLLLAIILNLTSNLKAFSIFPEVVGSDNTDSITLTFETFDTTSLPLAANPDSLKILRFMPDGSLLDSLGEEASNLHNVREGSYEVRFRGSDTLGTRGRYVIRAYAYIGGQIRGAASAGYYVKDGGWDDLDSTKAFSKAVLDTLEDGYASQTYQSYLDAPISTRSTLTESDNIGIDWLDIENPAAAQVLSSTIISGILGNVKVDTGKIARSVWDDELVSQNLRTVDLSSCGTGSGAYPCSLYVFNSADSSALQGIKVRVMNAEQTATEAVGISNSAGLIVVSLDAAEYRAWAYKAGIEFEGLPDSIDVSAPSSNDTIWGSSFDPGQPVSPELCRVFGRVFDLSGYGISGVTVMARLNKTPIRYDGSIISPFYRTASTDSTGYWYLDLIPSAALEPECEYEIVIYYESGRIARKRVGVPDQASWEFNW